MAGMCSGVKIRDIRKVLAKKELFFMVLMKFLKKRHSKNTNFVVLCYVCGPCWGACVRSSALRQ